MIPAGPQATCAAKTKYKPATPLTIAVEDVLQGVRALQVLREHDAEKAEQEDPLGGAEVAAVDPGGVDAERRPQPALALLADLTLGQHPVQPRLQDDKDQRDGDEDRHDRLERRGRQDEQQHGAGRPAEQGGRAEAQHAPALALELAPVADGAGHRARHEADGVRHVGRDRRVAEGEQHREGDQRPAADHRVDRPRRESGEADGDHLAEVHRGILGARGRARTGESAGHLQHPRVRAAGLEPVRTTSPVTGMDAFTTNRCARPGSNRSGRRRRSRAWDAFTTQRDARGRARTGDPRLVRAMLYR